MLPPPRQAALAGRDCRRAEGHVSSCPILFRAAALPASTVFYGIASCHSSPVLVQGESMALLVMSVPAQVYHSLPGGVHNQGCAALCEVSLRQGHKKLVTAPCLANRFGGPMALMLLGTFSFGFKHFRTRSSQCGTATEHFHPHHFFGTSFLQGTSSAPCVRPARDPRAEQQGQQESAGDQRRRRAGSMSRCDECEGC